MTLSNDDAVTTILLILDTLIESEKAMEETSLLASLETTKAQLETTIDELLTRVRFEKKKRAGAATRCEAAVVVMFAAEISIDVPGGNAPRITRAPLSPVRFLIIMDTAGRTPPPPPVDTTDEPRMSSKAPSSNVSRRKVTTMDRAFGFVRTIASMLKFTTDWGDAVTSTYVTFVHDAFTATPLDGKTVFSAMQLFGVVEFTKRPPEMRSAKTTAAQKVLVIFDLLPLCRTSLGRSDKGVTDTNSERLIAFPCQQQQYLFGDFCFSLRFATIFLRDLLMSSHCGYFSSNSAPPSGLHPYLS